MKKILILILLSSLCLLAVYFLSSFIRKDNKPEPRNEINTTMNETIESEKEKKRNKLIEQSDSLYQGYYYDEAIALLQKDPSLVNKGLTEKIENYKITKQNLVKYEGTIEHIFFHSLILYPEHLFPNEKKPVGGYNSGFSYQSELEKMLPQLYERGYVLYSLTDLFSKDENGKMKQNDIYLPKEKKPLILSIDDPTYHYGIGFAHKMILDQNGEIKTQVITPSKETIITDDGDVELIVDSFVKKHPDFSYQGAKGIVAATGYMGIFGYDLKTEDSIQQAKAVVDKLKENGWLFASHSYTHNREGYFGPNTKTSNIVYDTNKWKKTMTQVLGQTRIFIAPFGYTLKGDALDVILNNGFDIYCNVNFAPSIKVYDNYAFMSRIEIGGYSLRKYKNRLDDAFFNVDTVLDNYRPPLD